MTAPQNQPAPQQVNKPLEPKDQALQSVPPTVSARPATSAAVPATSPGLVLQTEPQQIEAAQPKEVIKIVDDNKDDSDQLATSVPRPKTTVLLTKPDHPTTGESGSATESKSNTQAPQEQGSTLNTLALVEGAMSRVPLLAPSQPTSQNKKESWSTEHTN